MLNSSVAEGVLSRKRTEARSEWILLAPYFTPQFAEMFSQHQINFIDLAGNCHLEWPGFFVHVAGRRRPVLENSTRLGRNGYKVLLALMVNAKLADVSIRDLAAAAGVSKSTAANARGALVRAGILHETRDGHVLEYTRLLDRWVAGYAELLRPSLLIGRYFAPAFEPVEFELSAEKTLRRLGARLALSGGAAAQRLTHHYRGDETTLHLETGAQELIKELRLAPGADGPIVLLRAPGPVIFDVAPKPNVAPAPLVFAELLHTGGERAREAAERVREKYLADYS